MRLVSLSLLQTLWRPLLPTYHMGTAIKHPVPDRHLHRMLYSCTHMATVGVQGLSPIRSMIRSGTVCWYWCWLTSCQSMRSWSIRILINSGTAMDGWVSFSWIATCTSHTRLLARAKVHTYTHTYIQTDRSSNDSHWRWGDVCNQLTQWGRATVLMSEIFLPVRYF